MMSHKTLLAHMTVTAILQTGHDVFACSLLHRELRNMCVYIRVEIELVVFGTIIQLLRQVSTLLPSACKQISLQAPAKWVSVTFMCTCYIARWLKDLCKHAI